MSDWLLYWKEKSDDYDPVCKGWHTRQERFFRSVRPGDTLWVVVRDDNSSPGKWALHMRIVVLRKQLVSAERPYCVLGDPCRSERFNLNKQADLEPVLHKLRFVTGKKIKARDNMIGRSLQAIRRLSDTDVLLLEGYSRKLARS